MILEEALSLYIGRFVELFTSNTFVQGTLLGAANGVISVDAINSGYSSARGPVSIAKRRTQFIRIVSGQPS